MWARRGKISNKPIIIIIIQFKPSFSAQPCMIRGVYPTQDTSRTVTQDTIIMQEQEI